MKNRIIAAAACLDDLASGTLGLEDTLREQAAAKEHVAMLYRLADALPGTMEALNAAIEFGLIDWDTGNGRPEFLEDAQKVYGKLSGILTE